MNFYRCGNSGGGISTATSIHLGTYADSNNSRYQTFTIQNPVQAKKKCMILVADNYGNSNQTILYINGQQVVTTQGNPSYQLSNLGFAIVDISPTDVITLYTYTVYSYGGGATVRILALE